MGITPNAAIARQPIGNTDKLNPLGREAPADFLRGWLETGAAGGVWLGKGGEGVAADWEAMKLEYVTGTEGLRAIAKKYGVSASQVNAKSKEEGWVQQRERFRSEAMALAMAHARDTRAGELQGLIQCAEELRKTMAKILEDPQWVWRHLVERREEYAEGEEIKTPNGTVQTVTMRQWTEDQIFHKADTKALRDMVAAVKDMTAVLRNLHELPTQPEREAQRIAGEKLKMEQRKLEDQNQTRTVEVVLGGNMADLVEDLKNGNSE